MYFPMDLKCNPTGKADMDDERERRALLDYCRLDTLAMVMVLQKLQEAVK